MFPGRFFLRHYRRHASVEMICLCLHCGGVFRGFLVLRLRSGLMPRFVLEVPSASCRLPFRPHASGLSLCLGPPRRGDSSVPRQGAKRSRSAVDIRLGISSWSIFLMFLGLAAFRLVPRVGYHSEWSSLCCGWSRARGVLLRWVARVLPLLLGQLLICGVSAWVTPGSSPGAPAV